MRAEVRPNLHNRQVKSGLFSLPYRLVEREILPRLDIDDLQRLSNVNRRTRTLVGPEAAAAKAWEDLRALDAWAVCKSLRAAIVLAECLPRKATVWVHPDPEESNWGSRARYFRYEQKLGTAGDLEQHEYIDEDKHFGSNYQLAGREAVPAGRLERAREAVKALLVEGKARFTPRVRSFAERALRAAGPAGRVTERRSDDFVWPESTCTGAIVVRPGRCACGGCGIGNVLNVVLVEELGPTDDVKSNVVGMYARSSSKVNYTDQFRKLGGTLAFEMHGSD
eukprot:tig00000681_g3100.t1